jgi:hypothetical protein
MSARARCCLSMRNGPGREARAVPVVPCSGILRNRGVDQKSATVKVAPLESTVWYVGAVAPIAPVLTTVTV